MSQGDINEAAEMIFNAARVTDVELLVSDVLPVAPTFMQDIVRQVRWGMKDIIEWCGDEVGPKPGEPTHAYLIDGRKAVISRELLDKIRERVGRLDYHYDRAWEG
jgi:hypothetical protein